MEDNFYNDEFEQFLRQQANNHRMYPTDGVWRGIYKKLHGDKKWPALTIAAFTFLVATIAISVHFGPKPNIFVLENSKTASTNISSDVKGTNPLLISSVTGIQKSTKDPDYVTNEKSFLSAPNSSSPNISLPPKQQIAEPTIEVAYVQKPDVLSAQKVQPYMTVSSPLDRLERVINENRQNTEIVDYVGDKKQAIQFPISEDVKSTIPGNTNSSAIAPDADDKNMADNFLEQHKNDLDLYTTNRKVSRKKKFSYTIYIAPSFSYRKLKEDEMLSRKNDNLNGPVALNYVTDVNKVVRHKPGTGMETGVAFTYHLTNSLGIKGGAQFNLRQYSMEAFRSATEVTTIALLRNNGVETINTYAVYRNNNGSQSTELVNRYYQLSFPLGMDWQVLGTDKLKLNIAANIQPTYTVNTNSYLLTTNFKNYTENKGMLRSWNMNSNVEAYLSFAVGEYKYQFGTQIRYQHLPTFGSEYPIREHLMDYGLKIGVSKLIK